MYFQRISYFWIEIGVDLDRIIAITWMSNAIAVIILNSCITRILMEERRRRRGFLVEGHPIWKSGFIELNTDFTLDDLLDHPFPNMKASRRSQSLFFLPSPNLM